MLIKAASPDETSCQGCPNGYNSNIGDCSCPSGQAVFSFGLDGALLTSKQCISCVANAYQGSTTKAVTSCTPCPHPGMAYDTNSEPWQCRCQASQYTQAGDTCALNSDVSTYLPSNSLQDAIRMDYFDVNV
mgnify:CR=1 FL=1